MAEIKFDKEKLTKIAREYQLADVYLFGSQIEGFQRKESDLDVAVRFIDGLPSIAKRGMVYGNLTADLNTCFPGYNIDLVFMEEAPLHFQFRIVSQDYLIYSHKVEESFDFKERVINYYRDYKYFIDEYFQGVLERVGTSAQKALKPKIYAGK